MKRTTLIIIIIVTYIATMAGMFFGVNNYIKKKDDRLRKELNDCVEKKQRKCVDVYCSKHRVRYERIGIPSRYMQNNNDWNFNKRKYDENYNDNYGDISKLYKLGSDDDYCDNGWYLIETELVTSIFGDGGRIRERFIYPYAVGERKKDYSWNYSMNVQNAVEIAFDYCINNENSDYSKYYEEGCNVKLWDDIRKMENEYYHFERDSVPTFEFANGYPLFEKYPYDAKENPSQEGYVQNIFWRVYFASSRFTTYSVKKFRWNPDIEERGKLHKIWSIILTIIMLSITIPLGISNTKHKRTLKETMYEKLKRLCNPSNFTKEYDTEKVSKANSLYKRLMELSPNDSEALFELQEQAVSDLGISLLDKEQVFVLKKKVNPEKYMEPYDADKVDLANELYAILSKKDLTYSEYIYVEQKAKNL